MIDTHFKPIVYLKQNCPFCMKVRLFLLEAGMEDDVETRDFAPGTPEEEVIRTEILPHVEKASFPTAQIEPGRYIAESDAIVSFLAETSGRDPAHMTVFRNYVDGPFTMAMSLWKENMELKKAAAGA